MGQKVPEVPKAPQMSKEYERGLKVYLRFLPKMLQKELKYRIEQDPQYLEHQLGLQGLYGPQMYAQQLAALQQFDPEGQMVRRALASGTMGEYQAYGPRREQLFDYLQAQMGEGGERRSDLLDYLQQGMERGGRKRENLLNDLQRQARGSRASRNQLQAYLRHGMLTQGAVRNNYRNWLAGQRVANDALRGQLRKSLGGELAAGTGYTDEELSQVQQQTRAAQLARGGGGMLGNAPAFEEALRAGQRGREIYQQRVQNTQNFLNSANPDQAAWQNFLNSPDTAAQQYQQFLATPDWANQQYGQFLNSPDVGAQQYGAFLTSPDVGAQQYQNLLQGPNMGLAQLGSFLASPTPMQQAGLIQPVTPDRGSQYANPNAGYLGTQFGLSNFPNQLANYQASLNQPNPWAGALGGAASGAMAGSSFGPYGAAIGGILGGAGGYFGFSDERIKENIQVVGHDRNGLPIVEYNYVWNPHKRFRGYLAQDVLKVIPEAVASVNGYLGINYDHPLIEQKLEVVQYATGN